MTLGDALYVGGFIILPIAIVSWCLAQLRSLRRRRFGRKSTPIESTAEFPIISRPNGTGEQPPEPVTDELSTIEPEAPPVHRDWAEAVRPTRGRQAMAVNVAANTAQRPFSPPIYAGKSAGVVVRLVPPAKRWPLAHFKAAHATPVKRRATTRR